LRTQYRSQISYCAAKWTAVVSIVHAVNAQPAERMTARAGDDRIVHNVLANSTDQRSRRRNDKFDFRSIRTHNLNSTTTRATRSDVTAFIGGSRRENSDAQRIPSDFHFAKCRGRFAFQGNTNPELFLSNIPIGHKHLS